MTQTNGPTCWVRRTIRMAWPVALCVVGTVLIGTPAASAAGKPTIGYQQASATTDKATLEALINPNGTATKCEVQYVTEAEFAASKWADPLSEACEESLGSGPGEVTATAQVQGLSLNTTYDYRFVAVNGSGTTVGLESSFVTFGIEDFTFQSLDEHGQDFAQAGGHPYAWVTTLDFKTNPVNELIEGKTAQVREMATLKDVLVHLPAGLVGDPAAVPQCPQYASERFACSPSSQVGTMQIKGGEFPDKIFYVPLFNLVPPDGVAARFGARINNVANAFINAGVRSGTDYGVDADSLNITGLGDVIGVKVTLWGDPASPEHLEERPCPLAGESYPEFGSPQFVGCKSEAPEKAFLSMPTRCSGPLSIVVEADAYQEPGPPYANASSQLPVVTGCSEVPFAPSLAADTSTGRADSPTGLRVDLHVPQNESPTERMSSTLKDATVTFPAGLAVNPSSANGLQGCSEEEVGFESFKELNPGEEPGVQTAQFKPIPAACPNAAKIGTVKIKTPLLDHELEGGIYLAVPHENPFGSLLAVYITVYDPISGVVVKLPGLVQANAQTGQLTTTFQQNPQLPFEDLVVSLFDEARAPLTTPMACGGYAASTSLTPWSTPEGGIATPTSNPPFEITEGAAGGSCVGSESAAPNKPALESGTVSAMAGSYSPFVMQLSREDGSQHFAAVNMTLPEGLIGNVSDVEECPQADIEAAQRRDHEGEGAREQSAPSCPAGSELGTAHVGAGSGSPFYVAGHVYFAGPYEGAPFSLVIVTPAIAGPFDLGAVVVRAALYIDPTTAQVTVKSDPLPTILDGIPLDVRNIDIEITRPQFTLNPTSCEAMQVTGSTRSIAGQEASFGDHFQVFGCKQLKFAPTFRVVTHAAHTRRFGAYLHVTIGSGAGQANLAGVKVELPRALVARESTLKLACSEAQFALNPAGCPTGSMVGTAVVHTPVLAVPLTGPAIFVSHGRAAFPDLDLVLQGDGVTVDQISNTNISSKGVTSSYFKAVPDVPVSSVELTLPAASNAALAANGNLCSETVKQRVKVRVHGKTVYRTRHIKRKRRLEMPTTIIGHNGAVIKKATIISVQGCPLVGPKHR